MNSGLYCPKPVRPFCLRATKSNIIICLLLCIGLRYVGVEQITSFLEVNPNYLLPCIITLVIFIVYVVVMLLITIFKWVFIKPHFFFELAGVLYYFDDDNFYVIKFDNTPHNNEMTLKLAKYREVLDDVEDLIVQNNSVCKWFRVVGFKEVTQIKNFDLLECNNSRTIINIDRGVGYTGGPVADYVIPNNFEGYEQLVDILKQRCSIGYYGNEY